MLSICIGHKNRGYVRLPSGALRPLFRAGMPVLADAIMSIVYREPVEVVIADFSDDQDLAVGPWVFDAHGIDIHIAYGVSPFSIGKGRNLAYSQARGDKLFFMDCDMLCPAAVLKRGLEVLDEGKAFAPLYDRLSPDGSVEQRGNGTGNIFVLRKDFEAVGGKWLESHDWAGDGDTAMWHELNDVRGLGVREFVPGFVHQWHPHMKHVT